MKFLSLLCIFCSSHAFSKDFLIDKVVGVINENIITLSEVNRIKETFDIRKEVSQLTYLNLNPTTEDILFHRFRSFIIREKIGEIGYVVGDDIVDSSITDTEKRLGIRRNDLLNFLKSRGLHFTEYFETIRETEEFNIFVQRIISPLVSITDQELKNLFLKKFGSSFNSSIEFDLVSYVLPANIVPKDQRNNFKNILEEYKKTGNIAESYSQISINQIEKINSDDLPREFYRVLKITDVNNFSDPVEFKNNLHVFYVQRREIMESKEFLERKEFLYNELFIQKSKDIILNWYQKEISQFYTLKNI